MKKIERYIGLPFHLTRHDICIVNREDLESLEKTNEELVEALRDNLEEHEKNYEVYEEFQEDWYKELALYEKATGQPWEKIKE